MMPGDSLVLTGSLLRNQGEEGNHFQGLSVARASGLAALVDHAAEVRREQC